jgi:hypothetical protein
MTARQPVRVAPSCGWKMERKGLCSAQREAASEETAKSATVIRQY